MNNWEEVRENDHVKLFLMISDYFDSVIIQINLLVSCCLIRVFAVLQAASLMGPSLVGCFGYWRPDSLSKRRPPSASIIRLNPWVEAVSASLKL